MELIRQVSLNEFFKGSATIFMLNSEQNGERKRRNREQQFRGVGLGLEGQEEEDELLGVRMG